MTTFSYQAHRLGESKKESGQVEAQSLAEATKLLREQGLLPITVTQGSNKTGFILSQKNVPLKEKLIFTRQLAVMIKAGLPAVKALEALGKQTNHKFFQSVIASIIKEVKGGQALSQVMGRYPKVFPEVYIAVVKAGEQTGQLSEVLFNLADQQEKQAELISKVRGAMMYPAIIFLALIGVVFLIVFFVLPSLKTVFADFGAELPLTTKLLFAMSDIVRKYFYIVLPVFAGLIYLIHLWFKRPSGRLVYDKIKIRIPIFGTLTTKVYMAGFSRTMSMLIRASLPILQSIKIVQKTINNKHYEAAFDRIAATVESGKPLSQALAKEPLFPPMVSQLTTLGEESGNMESVLLEVTRFYDSEVENMTKNLASLIEPIMLIVMGIGVAFVVASVLNPIYKLVSEFE
jgi:type IV pilus assembly protein PilC